MTEITIIRTEYPDSIELGRVSKGGIIKLFFNADDLGQAQKRIDNAIAARAYLVRKLAGGEGA
jgi:hypothetical protein